jgi:hypothetical protein
MAHAPECVQLVIGLIVSHTDLYKATLLCSAKTRIVSEAQAQSLPASRSHLRTPRKCRASKPDTIRHALHYYPEATLRHLLSLFSVPRNHAPRDGHKRHCESVHRFRTPKPDSSLPLHFRAS